MFILFRPNISLSPNLLIELTAEEQRHAKARRLKIGSPLFVGDGRYTRHEARLETYATALITDQSSVFKEREIHLFTAIPEKSRLEFLVEKAVELGVTQIQLTDFEYSQPHRFSWERLERIILEAAVQSQRFRLPVIFATQSIENIAWPDSLVVMHPYDEGNAIKPFSESRSEKDNLSEEHNLSEKENLIESSSIEGTLNLVVGPEGGLSKKDLAFFRNHGCRFLQIPSAILRVETAALAGMAILRNEGF